MLRIWCRVSGGVTGTREAWLKQNGQIREFETREQAQAEADRLNSTMNNSNSTAFFSYRVKEYDPWI